MHKKIIYFTYLFFLFIIPQLIHAAQDAVVSVSEASVYKNPDRESEVGETLQMGDKIKASNFQKGGWFKVRTKTGYIGWIWNKDISLDMSKSDTKGNQLDLAAQHKQRVRHPYPKFFIRPSFASYSLTSIQVGGYRYTYLLSIGGHLDFSFRLSDTYKATLRTGFYETPSGSNIYFSVNRYGFPVQAGLEAELSRTAHWKTAIHLLGGVDFSTVKITSVKKDFPPTAASTSVDPFGTASLLLKYAFVPRVLGLIEFGFFFGPSNSSGFIPPAFLNAVGSPKNVTKRFSGPIAALGLEIGI